MKKLFICFIVFLSTICILVPLPVIYAAPAQSATPTATTSTPNPASLKCASAVLMDASTGRIIYNKKPDEKIFPASTTKLMTVLLLLEKCKLDDEVTCGPEVDRFNSGSNGSSLVGLDRNEHVTVEELAYGCLIKSGNDAAAAAAVHVAGSQDAFAQLMNQKAKELGMTKTHFVNPHGLQDEQHYSTAKDMAILAQTALKNETIARIVATKTYTMPATNLSGPRKMINTNRLIANESSSDDKYLYQYATGMKTGLTPKAGGCLVASAQKDGQTLIATIYNDPTENGTNRWGIAKTLFEYGFSLQTQGVDTSNVRNGDAGVYSIVEARTLKEQVKDADKNDPQSGMLELTVTLDDAQVSALSAETVAAIKASPNSLEVNKKLNGELKAPIAKGTALGTATYSLNGQELFTGKLTASRDVAATGGVTAQASQPGYTVTPPQGGGFNILWVIIPAVLLLIILLRIMSKRRSLRRKRRRVSRRRTTYYNF
ncbi:MAG: D-alanyl-D-alanine carboxypeptidase family protein [Bacillota bacterium]